MSDSLTVALEIRDLLLRKAYYFTRDWHDAEDVLQDAYLRILPHLDTIPPEDVMGAMRRNMRWAWGTLLRHRYFGKRYPGKSQSKQQKTEFISLDIDMTRAMESSDSEPAYLGLHDEDPIFRLDVESAIAHLPERHRGFIMDYIFDEWTIKEWCREYGSQPKYVRRWLRSGHEALRESYEEVA